MGKGDVRAIINIGDMPFYHWKGELMTGKRTDSNRKILKKGEGQRDNGLYYYRWSDGKGNRNTVYAKTLEELREKELEIERDKLDGINVFKKNMSVSEAYDTWKSIKKGVKENTLANYDYMFNRYVRSTRFGSLSVGAVKKSTVRALYKELHDHKGLKTTSIDTIHNVLHQVFEMLLDDEIIRTNPIDHAIRDLKRDTRGERVKKKSLTLEQELEFLDYVKNSKIYGHWYPLFKVMFGTGMRIGEETGLQWGDIDFKNSIINISQTLVYFSDSKREGCRYAINSTKSEKGERPIPVSRDVIKALELERQNQKNEGVKCIANVDGYKDFVFVNRFGDVLNNGVVNKAIRRIVSDHNLEVCTEGKEGIIIPDFSCHTIRHTYITRLCEADVNIKVIQELAGHSDITTTMNIYADVTKEMHKNALV